MDATSRLPLNSLDVNRLRAEVADMWSYGYYNYIQYAYPLDELQPITCSGMDSWGSCSLTLIDSLDALVVFGHHTAFQHAVWDVVNNIHFSRDVNISVFETNIRVLGGLLSAHQLMINPESSIDTDVNERVYNNELLTLAVDLGERLLPAFSTPTGLPYGTVNLLYGVPQGETTVTCTAGLGTFSIEFGVLSRLSGNPIFEDVARRAIRKAFSLRSSQGLFGNHIDIMTGRWTHLDSGVGAGVDSFFEYLLKAAVLFTDAEYLSMFEDAYGSVMTFMRFKDWYVDVNMNTGTTTIPHFSTLHGFWPGLQVLFGDIRAAEATMRQFMTVWRKFGFTPESWDVMTGETVPGRIGYPLRPELAESLMYLYRATRNPEWLAAGRDIIASIQSRARTQCGFATIRNVTSHEREGRMESFFLSETLKYLYLLFDEDNFIYTRGPFVFSTEAHFFRVGDFARTNSTLRSAARDIASTGGGVRTACTVPFPIGKDAALRCNRIGYDYPLDSARRHFYFDLDEASTIQNEFYDPNVGKTKVSGGHTVNVHDKLGVLRPHIGNAALTCSGTGTKGQAIFWNVVIRNVGVSLFGPNVVESNAVTGLVKEVTEPELGCPPANIVDGVFGNIAFVERGGCLFQEKVTLLEQSGAVAVIIANTVDEQKNRVFNMHAGGDMKVNIHSVMVSGDVSDAMRSCWNENGDLTASLILSPKLVSQSYKRLKVDIATFSNASRAAHPKFNWEVIQSRLIADTHDVFTSAKGLHIDLPSAKSTIAYDILEEQFRSFLKRLVLRLNRNVLESINEASPSILSEFLDNILTRQSLEKFEIANVSFREDIVAVSILRADISTWRSLKPRLCVFLQELIWNNIVH